MTELRTSQVLNKAADLIEERGWTIGSGWPKRGFPNAELCLEGGIQAAMGVAEGPGYRCPAYDAVASYLNVTGSLFRWNDGLPFKEGLTGFVGGSSDAAMEHGKARVVETLRAAALIEQAKEADTLGAEFLAWQASEVSA